MIYGCTEKPRQMPEPVVEHHSAAKVLAPIPSGLNSPSLCYGSDWLNTFAALVRCNPGNERILLRFILPKSIRELGGEANALEWLSRQNLSMRKKLVAVQEKDTEYVCSYAAVVNATVTQFKIRLVKGDTLKLIIPFSIPL